MDNKKKRDLFFILCVSLVAVSPRCCAEEQSNQSVQTNVAPASAQGPDIAYQVPVNTAPSDISGVSQKSNSPDDLKKFREFPPANAVNAFDTLEAQKLAGVLVKASAQAGTLAKTVNDTVQDYVKDKRLQMRQQELVRNFYATFYQLTSELQLSDAEYKQLLTRVAHSYIEDGETGKYHLDATNLSDLPMIVKKEYGDIVLARTREGAVEVYYMNGNVKTQWKFKDGKPEGDVVSYYDDGEIKTIDIYKDGKRIHRKKYNRDGRLEFEQTYSYELPPLERLHTSAANKGAVLNPGENDETNTPPHLEQPEAGEMNADEAHATESNDMDPKTGGQDSQEKT